MPLKPVVDIAVNDEKFKEFMALFEQYRDALKDMPNDWSKINLGASGASSAFGEMSAALLAQAELLHRLNHEEQQFERHAATTARTAHQTATAFGNIARHVGSATAHLLKWGTVLGAGLVGGGLWGIDRLAADASVRRTAQLRLGVGAGTLQGYQAGLGQFANPMGAIGNIVALQQDLTRGPVAFNTLGIPGAETENPAAAYLSSLSAIRNLYRETPASLRQNSWWYQAATQIETPEEIRIFGNMSDREFQDRLREAEKLGKRFTYAPGELKGWQDLNRQLTVAGNTVRHQFTDALSVLTPEIGTLSRAFTKLSGDFLSSKLIKDGLTALKSGLDWLDRKLLDPAFEKRLETGLTMLASGVETAAADIVGVTKWFNRNFSTAPLPPPTASGKPAAAPKPFSSGSGLGYSFSSLYHWWDKNYSLHALFGSGANPLAGSVIGTAKAAGAGSVAIQALLAGAIGEGGLTKPWKPGDHHTSFGPWQLHRGGELDRYLASGGKPGDLTAQTDYVLKRLGEIDPGFLTTSDRERAIRDVARFENSKQPESYYQKMMPAAGKVLAEEIKKHLAGISPPPGTTTSGNKTTVVLKTGLRQPTLNVNITNPVGADVTLAASQIGLF